jgi:endonuclease/exonuclease/phosphatase family metal-dependent hydrolase
MLARRSASALRAPADKTKRLIVLLPCLIWVACAPPFDMIQEPRLPTCRGVVDVDGRPQTVDVRWFAPAAGSDRRVHAEWCGTVGPLVIEPGAAGRAEALPHTSHVENRGTDTLGQHTRPDARQHTTPRVGQPFRAAAQLDEIAIISWNVHVGGGDLIPFVNQLRAGAWSNGRPVAHFVLLLQEVFRRGPGMPVSVRSGSAIPKTIAASPPSGRRVDILEAAEQLGLSLFYAPSMRNGRSSGAVDEDRGNAILSTLPLSDFQVIELPFERQRRVSVAATLIIETPSGVALPLRVCSVHLDNRVTHRRLYVFAPPGRTRQTKGLLDALRDHEAIVLGGDFNTWLGGAEGTLRELRRAFPDTPRGTGATFGGARLDYLFFRLPPGWRGEWRVLNDLFGSDHRPVLGWLRPARPDVRDDRH